MPLCLRHHRALSPSQHDSGAEDEGDAWVGGVHPGIPLGDVLPLVHSVGSGWAWGPHGQGWQDLG